MAFDYSKARAKADRIINHFGNTGSVIKKGSTGGFDAGGNPLTDQPDIALNGIITPIIKYKNEEVDGSTIISGDGWVYFTSEGKPKTGMITAINSKVYRVQGVSNLTSTDDINVYTKLHLRKG